VLRALTNTSAFGHAAGKRFATHSRAGQRPRADRDRGEPSGPNYRRTVMWLHPALAAIRRTRHPAPNRQASPDLVGRLASPSPRSFPPAEYAHPTVHHRTLLLFFSEGSSSHVGQRPVFICRPDTSPRSVRPGSEDCTLRATGNCGHVLAEICGRADSAAALMRPRARCRSRFCRWCRIEKPRLTRLLTSCSISGPGIPPAGFSAISERET